MNHSFQSCRKTGVEKFVDYLMQIYDDSINSSNPSWRAGRKMVKNRYGYNRIYPVLK